MQQLVPRRSRRRRRQLLLRMLRQDETTPGILYRNTKHEYEGSNSSSQYESGSSLPVLHSSTYVRREEYYIRTRE